MLNYFIMLSDNVIISVVSNVRPVFFQSKLLVTFARSSTYILAAVNKIFAQKTCSLCGIPGFVKGGKKQMMQTTLHS